MATVKKSVTVKGYYLELSNSGIEIYRIATDGSGYLKRMDDTERIIREIAEEAGFERDYNISYRQYVSRLIQHITGLEKEKKQY